MSKVTLHQGDVLDVLPTLGPETFDACLCDPPYGLRFMGRAWDHGVPGEPVWREVLRALRPGAFVFVFGGTRTFHRLAAGIEDAGAEIRDSILAACWVYGSGLPKSLDVSKAIDAAAGAEREVTGPRPSYRPNSGATRDPDRFQDRSSGALTIAATPDARRWNGWGSALKPAWEPVVVGMKPLDGTFAENALDHGVAGLNIDGCRIFGKVPKTTQGASSRIYGAGKGFAPDGNQESKPHVAGRYPSNLVLSHHPECRREGTKKVRGSAPQGRSFEWSDDASGYSGGYRAEGKIHCGFTEPDGTETVPAYDCHPACPVAALDRASGERKAGSPVAGTEPSDPTKNAYGRYSRVPSEAYADSGTASRFYFQAEWERADFDALLYYSKADTAEREIGMAPGKRCMHPTLKPIALCAYLAKLLLPPPRKDGKPRRLLVPFAGAGSEIIGACRAGWDEVVGVEVDDASIADAEARVSGDSPLLVQVETRGVDP